MDTDANSSHWISIIEHLFQNGDLHHFEEPKNQI